MSSAESLADLVYTITGAPKLGEIQLDGTAVSEGGTFTQQAVNDNRVTYALLILFAVDQEKCRDTTA